MAMADIGANPVPIAVIGAGRWGAHLVRIFLEHPGAALVAVAEGDRDRWDELAAKFGDHPAWGAVRHVADGFGALAIADLGAVAIATPASGHYDLVTAALERGLHVFVEKPLTLDGDQCDRLGTLAQRQGRHLFVDHTYLFHPAVEAGAAWLRSPDVEDSGLGQLHYGYGARVHLGPIRQDVDVLWDLAIHDIAIFNHWLNDTPIAVRAWGQTWLQPGNGDSPQGDRPDPAAGLADLTWVQLRYGSGVTATVHLCWNNPDKQRRLALTGDRGTLIFDELDASAPLRVRQGSLEQRDGRFLPRDERDRGIPTEPGQSLSRACDRFLADLHRAAPDPRASPQIAATLVRILAAASRSLRQDGQVQPIP
jgi:predicted dehydrogenase